MYLEKNHPSLISVNVIKLSLHVIKFLSSPLLYYWPTASYGVSLILIILIILPDVFVTKLFFRDPVISLHIDDVEGLVKLKCCSQGLEKQSELPKLQIIIAILAITLQDKNIIKSSLYY